MTVKSTDATGVSNSKLKDIQISKVNEGTEKPRHLPNFL